MRSARLLMCVAVAAATFCASADEYRLPNPAEISGYSPDAMQFYTAGVKAIDKVDLVNAYAFLSKAAQLEPTGVRLNYIAAALAVKHGRANRAADAQDFYETAIACYSNMLKNPDIDSDLRREVENRLKIASDEQANLAKRDTRREALGGQFVLNWNHEYAPPTPREQLPMGVGGVQGTPALAGVYGAGANPMVPQPGNVPLQPIVPGAGTPAYPSAIPTAAAPPLAPDVAAAEVPIEPAGASGIN